MPDTCQFRFAIPLPPLLSLSAKVLLPLLHHFLPSVSEMRCQLFLLLGISPFPHTPNFFSSPLIPPLFLSLSFEAPVRHLSLLFCLSGWRWWTLPISVFFAFLPKVYISNLCWEGEGRGMAIEMAFRIRCAGKDVRRNTVV